MWIEVHGYYEITNSFQNKVSFHGYLRKHLDCGGPHPMKTVTDFQLT